MTITNEEALPIITAGLKRVAEAYGIGGSTYDVRQQATRVLTDMLFPVIITAGAWEGLLERTAANEDSLPVGWDAGSPLTEERRTDATAEAHRRLQLVANRASRRQAERAPRAESAYTPPTPPPVDPRPCLCGCGEEVYFGFYRNRHNLPHQRAVARAVLAGTHTPAEGLDLMPTKNARTRLAALLKKQGIPLDDGLIEWSGPEYCALGHEQSPENTQPKGGCRACQRIHKNWRSSEYRAIVDAARSQPCVDCGLSLDPCQVDLDHLPGFEKTFTVSQMVGNPSAYTRDQLEAELAKCEVVCVNCHRLRTTSRWGVSKAPVGIYIPRHEWYAAQKAHPCTDCGVQYPPVAMDFDHLPEHPKEEDVSGMVTGWSRLTLPDGSTRLYTIEEMAAEVAKCELVCACCHRLRTKTRKATA